MSNICSLSPAWIPFGQTRGEQKYSLPPRLYGEFLCGLFDLWYRDWKNGQYRSVRLFNEYVNLMLGDPAVTCSTCGNCGAYFVVEGDGSVYPCDFFVLDKWKLGKLGEDSLGTGKSCASAKISLQFQETADLKNGITCKNFPVLCFIS